MTLSPLLVGLRAQVLGVVPTPAAPQQRAGRARTPALALLKLAVQRAPASVAAPPKPAASMQDLGLTKHEEDQASALQGLVQRAYADEPARRPALADPSMQQEWVTGPDVVVDREGLAHFTDIIRGPDDPERSDIRKLPEPLRDRTAAWRRTIKKSSVGDWGRAIWTLLSDGTPRTFNRLGVELADKTADLLLDLPPHRALWALVAEGRVEHTMHAPIYFRARAGSTLPTKDWDPADVDEGDDADEGEEDPQAERLFAEAEKKTGSSGRPAAPTPTLARLQLQMGSGMRSAAREPEAALTEHAPTTPAPAASEGLGRETEDALRRQTADDARAVPEALARAEADLAEGRRLYDAGIAKGESRSARVRTEEGARLCGAATRRLARAKEALGKAATRIQGHGGIVAYFAKRGERLAPLSEGSLALFERLRAEADEQEHTFDAWQMAQDRARGWSDAEVLAHYRDVYKFSRERLRRLGLLQDDPPISEGFLRRHIEEAAAAAETSLRRAEESIEKARGFWATYIKKTQSRSARVVHDEAPGFWAVSGYGIRDAERYLAEARTKIEAHGEYRSHLETEHPGRALPPALPPALQERIARVEAEIVELRGLYDVRRRAMGIPVKEAPAPAPPPTPPPPSAPPTLTDEALDRASGAPPADPADWRILTVYFEHRPGHQQEIDEATRRRVEAIGGFVAKDWTWFNGRPATPLLYLPAAAVARTLAITTQPGITPKELDETRDFAVGFTGASADLDIAELASSSARSSFSHRATHRLDASSGRDLVAVRKALLPWQVLRWGGDWTPADATAPPVDLANVRVWDDGPPTWVRTMPDGTSLVELIEDNSGRHVLAVHTDPVEALHDAENLARDRYAHQKPPWPETKTPRGVPLNHARVDGWQDGGPVVEITVALPDRGKRGEAPPTTSSIWTVRGYLKSVARRNPERDQRHGGVPGVVLVEPWTKAPPDARLDGRLAEDLGYSPTFKRLINGTLDALPAAAKVKPTGRLRTAAPFVVGQGVRYVGATAYGLPSGAVGVCDFIRRPRGEPRDMAELVFLAAPGTDGEAFIPGAEAYVELVGADDVPSRFEPLGRDERIPEAPETFENPHKVAKEARLGVKALDHRAGHYEAVRENLQRDVASSSDAVRDHYTARLAEAQTKLEDTRRELWRWERALRLAEAQAKVTPRPVEPEPPPSDPLPEPTDEEREAWAEKREARIDRLETAAARVGAQAAEASARAHQMGSRIPFGQPVHGVRDRNFRDRIWNTMGRSVRLYEEAAALNSAAEAAASNKAIFSEDPDAIAKLTAEIERREDLGDWMVDVNKALRKDDRAKLAELGLDEEGIAKLLKPDFLGRRGYADYTLTSNRAQIARLKERVAHIKTLRRRTVPEPVKYGEVEVWEQDGWVRIWSPRRVSKELYQELRQSGFVSARKVRPTGAVFERRAIQDPDGSWYRATPLAQRIAREIADPSAPSTEGAPS